MVLIALHMLVPIGAVFVAAAVERAWLRWRSARLGSQGCRARAQLSTVAIGSALAAEPAPELPIQAPADHCAIAACGGKCGRPCGRPYHAG